MWLYLNKRDEYQLINYICWYKVMILVKYALYPILTGYFRYYICAVSAEEDACKDPRRWFNAPGLDDGDQYSITLLCVQYVWTLYAFCRYLWLRRQKQRHIRSGQHQVSA